MEQIQSHLLELIHSEFIASSGDYFQNEVEYEKGVILIDKLGNAKANFKQGKKVMTKVHPKDPTFYLIEVDDQILFAKRSFFKLK